MFNHNCLQNDFNKLKMFANKKSLNYKYKITSKIKQTILNVPPIKWNGNPQFFEIIPSKFSYPLKNGKSPPKR
jgi:hypothetical protein